MSKLELRERRAAARRARREKRNEARGKNEVASDAPSGSETEFIDEEMGGVEASKHSMAQVSLASNLESFVGDVLIHPFPLTGPGACKHHDLDVSGQDPSQCQGY